MVESTLLVSGQYCDAVGKEAIKPTTPVLDAAGVDLLATTAFQTPEISTHMTKILMTSLKSL
jgi:hypothetical protein